MLSDFLIRLRALFWRNAVENELNDELSLRPPVRAIHIQFGLPAPEAHRRAPA